jgi:hypothetical protein
MAHLHLIGNGEDAFPFEGDRLTVTSQLLPLMETLFHESSLSCELSSQGSDRP